MIKAVIFDMDGVIIDSEPYHVEAGQVLMKKYGVNLSKIDFLEYLGTTAKFIFEDLIKKYNLSVSWDALNKEKEYYFIPLLKEKALLVAGVLDLINYLKNNNFSLAIASSSKKILVDIVIKKFNFGNMFDVSVSGDEIKNSKPNPEIFMKAAKLLNIHPSECLVIEDAPYGVKASKEAGMKCIAFNNQQFAKQIFSGADFMVTSLNEVKDIIKKFY